MTLDEYVVWAAGIGSHSGESAMLGDALGFASEVGEVAGVLAKGLRDGGLARDRLADELGDVAFHWARLSVLTGITPSTLLARSRAHVEWRRAGRPVGGPASAPPTTLEEFTTWAAEGHGADGVARPGDEALGEVALALAGDAGEVIESLRRLAREGARERERLAGELGDVWRYWVRLAVASGVAPGELLARSRAKIVERVAKRTRSGDAGRASPPRLPSVTSADGTAIAYERSGTGPPLVLVHGSISDHTYWTAVLPALSARFTLYAMERRGRGHSGDAAAYSIEREAQDVAAIVDTIAEPVALLGHSYGALCALETALLTDRLSTLVLYEPPLDAHAFALPAGFVERLETMLAAGDREQVVETMMREVVGLSPAELTGLRAGPSWPSLVAAAHTLPREVRVVLQYRFDPDRFRRLVLPTVLLAGTDSPDAFRVVGIDRAHRALRNSRVVMMPGVGHEAVETGPAAFAAAVLRELAPTRQAPPVIRRSPREGKPRRSSSARRRSR